jgi:hypothetical protein
VSHINGRVHRRVNDGNDYKRSGRSHRTARRGDWAVINDSPPSRVAERNRYDVTIRGPVGDVFGTLLAGYDSRGASAHTVMRDLRLDAASLRRLVERARTLGLEVVDVRLAPAGGGRYDH